MDNRQPLVHLRIITCDVGAMLRPLAPGTKAEPRDKFTHIVPSRTFSFELRFSIFCRFLQNVLPHSYAFFLASCLECFEKMENIVQRCEAFTKRIDCELNDTAKECEEGKTFIIKYCSNKECTGISI